MRLLPYPLSMLLGLLYPLGFAPINLPIITLLGLLIWCWYCLNQASSFKAAFAHGMCFGTMQIFASAYWLHISLTQTGGLPLIIAWLLVLLLSLFLALGHGALAMGYRLCKQHWPHLASMAFALMWVIIEYLRAHTLSGFPWLMLAQSQLSLPTASLIPILGPYGIAWLLLLLPLSLCQDSKKAKWLAACMISATLLASSLLQHTLWTSAQDKQISPTIYALQPNISVIDKWFASPNRMLHTLQHQSVIPPNAWVIWPEGSIIAPTKTQLKALDAWAKLNQVQLIAGSMIDRFNSILTFPSPHQIYYKQHMVPFGEYNPLPTGISQWLEHTWPTIPFSHLAKGPNHPTLALEDQVIAPSLCYDIVFPNFVKNIGPDVGWILTLSEDVWFGESLAPFQHVQAARLRALEMQKPLLFVNNSGPSAHIDAHGKIVKETLPFASDQLKTQMTPHTGLTPYGHYGNLLWWGLALLYTLLLCAMRDGIQTTKQ